MDLLSALSIGLATWRLSHMMLREEGPWRLFVHWRERWGVEHDEDFNPVSWPDGSVLACLWCFSVWVGAALAILPVWVSVPFALSAFAIMVEKWLEPAQ